MLQIFKHLYPHINVQSIIAAAMLVPAVFLLCCYYCYYYCYCYCCYCKNTGRHYQVSLESCDGCCLTIHIVSKKSVGHDLPVLQKRTLTPLPNNFHNFITATIIPSFEKQRLIGTNLQLWSYFLRRTLTASVTRPLFQVMVDNPFLTNITRQCQRMQLTTSQLVPAVMDAILKKKSLESILQSIVLSVNSGVPT